MRKIFILSIFVISCLASNELSWVDEQVNAIKPNRNGVSNRNISKLRNPFIYLKKNMSEKSKTSKKPTSYKRTRVTSNGITKSSNNSKETASLQKVTTPNVILTLSAIINSSALINGEWYKLGQKVNNYKIVRMYKTSVTLTKGKKTTVLTTESSTNKLKFK